MTEKPNIIYIFSDQHRGDTLGCVGHPTVITPNLDKLASQGVNFTKCFTNSPLCMPARASMMSGQYVYEHGVWTNEIEANPLGPSHVRNIYNAGYHTAVIGKTHLYRHGGKNRKRHIREKAPILKNWGFVDIHELTGPIATIKNDSFYTDFLKERGLLKIHRNYMINYVAGWERGQSKPWEVPPSPLHPEEHLDSYTGRIAMEWIQQYKRNKPFYLQILFPGPHDPFDSPIEYRKMYNPEACPVAIMRYPQNPIPTYVKMVLKWSGLDGMTESQNKLFRSFYYAKITLIDEYIGKIMSVLKEKDLLNNTWIIYNSDHGEMLGDHMLSHKIVFYEGALRIPLIVRPPGGLKGRKSQNLTDHLDIAASLIEIAGAKPLEGSDGRSFVPLIKEGNNNFNPHGKDLLLSEVFGFSMVRNERYKLAFKTSNRKPVEFYDLEEDPNELNNLVKDPSHEPLRKELLKSYCDNILNRTKKE